jgi:hypothetical protein
MLCLSPQTSEGYFTSVARIFLSVKDLHQIKLTLEEYFIPLRVRNPAPSTHPQRQNVTSSNQRERVLCTEFVFLQHFLYAHSTKYETLLGIYTNLLTAAAASAAAIDAVTAPVPLSVVYIDSLDLLLST